MDTLRADALGTYGRTTAQTPRIDRLAAHGIQFDRAHAHNVTTLPSHANILTGRLPLGHGVRDNAGYRLPDDVETLATLLKNAGYRTGAFVSAFPLDSRFGLNRGFDVYDDRFVDVARTDAFLIQERPGSETVALARQWLDAQGNAPMFCWVHLYEPHFPYAPPEPLASRFVDRAYDGEVAAADLALAPLLDPLLEAGPAGRTLVVFTSDHGESLGEHGEATHGIFAYEAALRVPLILYYPARWQPRRVSDPARHIDIVPTVLQALGRDVPPGLSGRSLLPAARGDRLAPEPTYFEALSGALNRGWAPLRGVIRDGRKFIDLPIPELYDLQADARETRNLAPERAEDVERFREVLEAMQTHQRQLGRSPVDAETRDRLRSLGYVGANTEAKRRYTEADDPKNLMALDALMQEVTGRLLDGDLPGALQRARELVRRRTDMRVAWLQLGHLERESGNIGRALEALERARSLSPDDPETLSLLGAYLTEAGRAAEAVKILDTYASPADADVSVLRSYGLALGRLGRYRKASATLDRAKALDPSNAILHLDAGTIDMMAGAAADARAEFEAALAANPAAARAHISLGALDVDEGRPERAVEHWDRGVAADPRELRTILGMGLGLARGGHLGRARPYLEFFVARAAPSAEFSTEVAIARRVLASGGRR